MLLPLEGTQEGSWGEKLSMLVTSVQLESTMKESLFFNLDALALCLRLLADLWLKEPECSQLLDLQLSFKLLFTQSFWPGHGAKGFWLIKTSLMKEDL